MTCECRDKNGQLLDRCIGSCVRESIIQQDEQARRDPMQGFAELILSQVDSRIENKINRLKIDVEKEKIEIYKKAFLEGIKEGFAMAQELNRKDDY